MEAASSRDHLISQLEAAPTGVFYGNLDFPDERLEFIELDWASRREKIKRSKGQKDITCRDKNGAWYFNHKSRIFKFWQNNEPSRIQ